MRWLLFLQLTGCAILGLRASDLRDSIAWSVTRGANFLYSAQRDDGAICDSIHPLFETWETIAALHAIIESGSDTTMPGYRKAMEWVQGQVNPMGLLCHNRRCALSWCLETSAEYARLQYLTGKGGLGAGPTDSLIRWQRPDGSWLIGNPDVVGRTDFPSVTAFTLGALIMSGYHGTAVNTGSAWLQQMIHPDTLWGSSWEYYGSRWYAAWPAATLIAIMPGKKFRKTANLICSALRKAAAPMDHPGGISAELDAAFMLSAWVPLAHRWKASRKDIAQIQALARFLLSCQREDGSWKGGQFPIPSQRYGKEEYLFCTARIVSIFSGLLRTDLL